ncbi:MAG: UDP-N-acetylmuramoyl-L-alanyl-D-glutamate--2,6-diaminopimelate ligase [Acidobacteria bacterium]|nr:UDP-N-acetylmuramoyl-L-alanyl-D-glutamate--2,6-diaminopimelate ligase [Acidobacteriota bacterium]
MKLKLRDLLGTLEGAVASGMRDVEVAGLTYDSRKVRAGFVFVAMRGERTDGSLYVRDALERGAVAVVSETGPLTAATPWITVSNAREALARLSNTLHDYPSRKIRLVGVTGTNGKTTTTFLVESVLGEGGDPVALAGTVESRVGGRVQPSTLTTPEAPDLHDFLVEAIQAGCRWAVMEVSSHALHRHRVDGNHYRAAVFTNLSRDHLDYHGSFEAYFAAKKRLFGDLGDGAPDHAIVNADDEWGQKLVAEMRHRNQSVWTYGLDRGDLRGERPTFSFSGIQFEAIHPGGKLSIRSPLIGRANLYNLLATVATGQALGVPGDAIQAGIEKIQRVPGRYEQVDCGQPFLVMVDYAHTDDALRNLLQVARQLCAGRIITLFGCGGDRDRTKRPIMGEVAGTLSDRVVVTSDNPRSEDPEAILRDVEEGLKKTGTPYRMEVDRREAIRIAMALAATGDIVLLAGKGHESRQVLRDVAIPFDDRKVAREVLREMGYGSA